MRATRMYDASDVRVETSAVVGDCAVGLCGVIAARRLGAEQLIMLGQHADRIALARHAFHSTLTRR